ncbi:MAG TPA: hypothetical protein VK550_17150 [Polyangiaceae bacterium]|nr:hypothetical protein [Polyangiaceae bacterium]
MDDPGAGHPAARAMVRPPEPSEDNLSGARLTASLSEGLPVSAAHPVQADWAQLAAAPTLLLTPVDPVDTDAASTSRIATPPATALEEQPWFRTGTTVAPPSMRPTGESMAPSPMRKPPNPRVLKAVACVIATCIFIVAIAGLKLLYQRISAPSAAPRPSEETTARTVLATANLGKATGSGPESAPLAEQPTSASESNVPSAPPTAATETGLARRARPVRPSPTPARGTSRTTTRRAPATKKTTRATHQAG